MLSTSEVSRTLSWVRGGWLSKADPEIPVSQPIQSNTRSKPKRPLNGKGCLKAIRGSTEPGCVNPEPGAARCGPPPYGITGCPGGQPLLQEHHFLRDRLRTSRQAVEVDTTGQVAPV